MHPNNPLDAWVASWEEALARALAGPQTATTGGPPPAWLAELPALADHCAAHPERPGTLAHRLAEAAARAARRQAWRRRPFATLSAERLAEAAQGAASRAVGRLVEGGDRLAEMAPAGRGLWFGGIVAEAARTLLPLVDGGGDEAVCHRSYSPELQLQALALGGTRLDGPILDLGCGQGALVAELRRGQRKAVGIDRDLPEPRGEHLREVSWLDFPYQPGCWGTVVSHLAFSLHFWHQHLVSADGARAYARCLMAILRGLAPGGLFAFVPSLPFITGLLDPAAFSVAHMPVPAALARPPDGGPLAAALPQALAQATHVRRHGLRP